MTTIPADAAHWDTGDWIEWHRTPDSVVQAPCSAASDTGARLMALEVSLLRSARVHFHLTGDHLPVYEAIARVHAALHYDVPLDRSRAQDVLTLVLPPMGPGNTVTVDLSHAFRSLLVVRIRDNFTTESRMCPRAELRTGGSTKSARVSWASLPDRS
ncbi:hypothetical protein [uncultured Roseobacter sp.]|uniref:hypothetical protein n=1 Tax=uncultured Roseobacter sp. TaxID=114847 RepID=UPI0026069965|nr:hypothetical protein [uncultured Roseobacter sp.]